MRYLLLLFSLLSIKGFSQQSALDSIAIQIQTYINKNKIKLESRLKKDSYEFSYVNDSLYLKAPIDFVHFIDFEKSKLKDSFEYNLKLIIDPIADTTIVDLYQGWNISDAVFPNSGVYGEFVGGFKKHSYQLFTYIKNSETSLIDSIDFRVYFHKEAPYKGFYVECRDTAISKLVLDYYNSIALQKYSPPIRNGRVCFSSHLLKYKKSANRIYHEGYREYDSLLISDQCIYSLSEWKVGDSPEKALIFDRKKKLEDLLTQEFLAQFESNHHDAICELVNSFDKRSPSGIFNVSVLER